MNIKTFEAYYSLVEFNHYIQQIDEDTQISVLELILDADESQLDYLTEELSEIFVIETEGQYYIFSDYEVEECYETDDGLIHITCVK